MPSVDPKKGNLEDQYFTDRQISYEVDSPLTRAVDNALQRRTLIGMNEPLQVRYKTGSKEDIAQKRGLVPAVSLPELTDEEKQAIRQTPGKQPLTEEEYELVKPELKAMEEDEALKEPWIDPMTAMTAAGGSVGYMGWRVGAKVTPTLVRSLTLLAETAIS